MATSYRKAERIGLTSKPGRYTSFGFVESPVEKEHRSYAGLGCIMIAASVLLGFGINYMLPGLGITVSLVIGFVVGLVLTS